MFAIWYTAFAWNEYRHEIVKRIQQVRRLQIPQSLLKTQPPPPEPCPDLLTNIDDPSNELSIPEPVLNIQPDTVTIDIEDTPKSSRSSSPVLISANNLPNFEIFARTPSPDPLRYQKEASLAFLDMEKGFSHKKGTNEYDQNGFESIDSKSKDMAVSQEVLDKLESEFAKLEASDSKSLLKKYLTREIFDKLKTKTTPSFGSTLLDCIQSGLANHDSGVGIYAPDAEAYTVFADLFDPIIEDYHQGFKKGDKHPARDFGDCDTLGNLDPNNEYVVSTRVRCGRSLEGYPFNPCLTEEQYKEMQDKVSNTLSGMEGELKGTYYPLAGMTKEVQQKLIDDHFLFKEGDRFLQTANACRYWPTGRGIYHNDNKTFLVWCNEEDHLRIISMQMGGDLGEVYRRLVTAVNDIEKRIPFSHDDRLGFLTFCPTNLGTTIRASVHIKVPKLAANKAKLDEVAGKFNLQVRGTRGEHTEAEGGIYDISNKRRMGLTEYQAVKEMYDGITELIKIEKEL